MTNGLYAHPGNTKLNVVDSLFLDFYVPIKTIENHSIWLPLISWFSIAIPQVWFGFARLQRVIALLWLDNDNVFAPILPSQAVPNTLLFAGTISLVATRTLPYF